MHVLLTYTHCTVNYIVDIKCLNCGRHCSIMGCCLVFFSQKVLLGLAWPLDLRLMGFARRPNLRISGLDAQQDPLALVSAA